MIEDQELQELFQNESNEHLQALEDGLLELELHPDENKILERTFREAHSLKGAARMLGLTKIEVLSHHYEDLLHSAFLQSHKLQPNEITLLYQGVDMLRTLVNEALGDESSEVDISDLLEALKIIIEKDKVSPPLSSNLSFEENPEENKEHPVKTETTVDTIEKKSNTEPGKSKKNELEHPLQTNDKEYSISNKEYQIKTIRVKTEQLDTLMNLAGELSVTRLRINQRMSDIEDLQSLWEDWNTRYLHQYRMHAKNNSNGEREAFFLSQFGEAINKLKETIYEDNARLSSISTELNDGISTIRLLPLSTLFKQFPRMLRDIAFEQKKSVQFLMEGEETAVDKRIIEALKDPLMHMIRNAIDHGIEVSKKRQQLSKPAQGQIKLKAYQLGSKVFIEVIDDGNGLNINMIREAIKKQKLKSDEEIKSMTEEQLHQYIFVSGISTQKMITDISGRGVGMDVVQHNIEKLKGNIRIESKQGIGCRFIVELPTTLAIMQMLIINDYGNLYAIPLTFVKSMQLLVLKDIFTLEGSDTMLFKGRPVSVAMLKELMELDSPVKSYAGITEPKVMPCVILSLGDKLLALLVEDLQDEQEIMFKSHSRLLQRVRNVDGSTILGNGDICTVLNVHDLFRSVQAIPVNHQHIYKDQLKTKAQVILLVEDSITTRAQEKRIMENAGYQVITAVDGVDAYKKLKEIKVDALVSDIQMPNMDGLTLVEKIRKENRFEDLPIILVTMLTSDEDRKRGMEVGANAYISKPAFDQAGFLDTLKRLIVV